MKPPHLASLCALALCLAASASPAAQAEVPLPATADAAIEKQPIEPVPVQSKGDPRKIALGQALFHEKKLSHDDSISCATCHSLQRGGADGRVFPIGIGGAVGTINTPTVFNSGLNFRQFWDGRASTLEEQVDSPLLARDEMGSTWPEIIAKLRQAPAYVAAFRSAYAEAPTRENVRHALAEYERSLLTVDAPIDRYLRGDAHALTPAQSDGFRKFKSYGCSTCHQGMNIGGNMYQTLGALSDYFTARGQVTKADLGRFNVTGRDEDRFVFKVPSLRNVALTAPYFHDGSAATLEAAVEIMARYQLGRTLSPADLSDLTEFLRALTGEYHP